MDKYYKHILAIDPGKTSGWAALSQDGHLIEMGQLLLDDMLDFINDYPTSGLIRIVVEDYVVFRRYAAKQTGSRHEAIQVIGALKSYSKRHNIPLTLQGSEIKRVAEKWSGMTPYGQHSNSHWIDAFNHGYYYLVKHGHAKTRLQIEKERQDGAGQA